MEFLPPNCTKFVIFPHFPMLSTKNKEIKIGERKLMVMENQEMVMKKSWENMLSSLWEPCQCYKYEGTKCRFSFCKS